MKTLRSPFRPSFGTTPPVLAGRDAIAGEIGDALDDGPGARGRAVLFTGNRGIGKTVMLNETEALARERGWVVLSETATPGLLERMTQDGMPALADLVRQAPARGRRVKGVSVSGVGGLEFDLPPVSGPGGFRAQLDAITDQLAPHGTGVLLTLDEVHSRKARDEVTQLCAVVQHAFREERPVAFAAAGLPAAVQDLLAEDVSTFLRRARRFVLEPLTPVAAETALERPIQEAGRSIESRALRVAAEATYGYPFLVQLVGDHAWRQDTSVKRITTTHVAVGGRGGPAGGGHAAPRARAQRPVHHGPPVRPRHGGGRRRVLDRRHRAAPGPGPRVRLALPKPLARRRDHRADAAGLRRLHDPVPAEFVRANSDRL